MEDILFCPVSYSSLKKMSACFLKDCGLKYYETSQKGGPLCVDVQSDSKVFKMATVTMVTNKMLKYENYPGIVTDEQKVLQF